MRAIRSVFGLGLLVAVAGCSQPNPPTLNKDRQSIIGGTQATVGQFPSVVAVLEQGVGSLCTGTLISPTAILTAAHCLDPTELGTTAAKVKTDTIVIFDSVDLNNQNQGFAVALSNVIENPNHPNFGSQTPDLGHDDDAILILSQAVTDRSPSPVDLDPNANNIGVNTTQTGFGINDPANQQSAGTEFFIQNKPTEDCNDFPGGGATNANMICFDQTDNKGQCNGDSGGPAFNAGGVVIGVVSFGDQNCTQFGADTRPSQTADFIRNNVPDLGSNSSGPVCGNGAVESGEECDHGAKNGTAGDSCDASCNTVVPDGPVCGNGTVETGEACDDGSANGTSGDKCSATCTKVGTGSNGDNGGSSSGCSVGGETGSSFVLLVLGLGFAVSRRRRR